MVPVQKKQNLVSYLIVHGYVTNPLSINFFKEAIAKENVDVIFTSTLSHQYKYSISLNASTKQMSIRINGKHFRSFKILKYVLRAVEESKGKEKLYIYINTDGRDKLTSKYREAVWDMDSVKNVISECFVDYVLSNSKKENFKRLIDQALDSKNVEEFERLTTEFKKEFCL